MKLEQTCLQHRASPGTLDVPADPTCRLFLVFPCPSILEWPSICIGSFPLRPTNFSHTFDPTQCATQSRPHRLVARGSDFLSDAQASSSQFHPSLPGNVS